MAWSNEPKSKKPVSKYIRFKGSEGKFTYRDKQKEKEINVPTPFKMLVIEELHTVKGYHDASQSAIYSNEVKDLNSELRVKAFEGGDLAAGKYADIKDKVKGKGAKYAKSIYCLIHGELVNLTLVGASLSAYIEKGFDTKTMEVSVDDEIRKKGTNEYYVPIFEETTPTPEEVELANEASSRINEYLDDYLSREPKEEPTEDTTEVTEDTDEDLPF